MPSETKIIGEYQLGDAIGKGAFGIVYRGLNMATGETVAVKQIELQNIQNQELDVMMLEIDLLKKLKHPNIVRYSGFIKTKRHLNILLEFCENGSLHSIYKKFGKFPEPLVRIYTAQILAGLQYLHEQGVIHRDIKGANILTTKEGRVKLADFGVATIGQAALVDDNDKTIRIGKGGITLERDTSVVGSPYWMAPEIIELCGATTASDIWSVGCVVIELIEGHPPYHNLAPMPALFRIVQDDHPPLPEGVSAAVKDFLMQCFQKDCNLRVSAKKLLKHPWILGVRKNVVDRPQRPTTFNEVVESVQQWNRAVDIPVPTGNVNGTIRSVRSAKPPRQKPVLQRNSSQRSNSSSLHDHRQRSKGATEFLFGKKEKRVINSGPDTQVSDSSLGNKRNSTVLSEKDHTCTDVHMSLPKSLQPQMPSLSLMDRQPAMVEPDDENDHWDDFFIVDGLDVEGKINEKAAEYEKARDEAAREEADEGFADSISSISEIKLAVMVEGYTDNVDDKADKANKTEKGGRGILAEKARRLQSSSAHRPAYSESPATSQLSPQSFVPSPSNSTPTTPTTPTTPVSAKLVRSRTSSMPPTDLNSTSSSTLMPSPSFSTPSHMKNVPSIAVPRSPSTHSLIIQQRRSSLSSVHSVSSPRAGRRTSLSPLPMGRQGSTDNYMIYAEMDEGSDYSELLDGNVRGGKDGKDASAKNDTLKLHARYDTTTCDSAPEESDEDDPFADMDEDFEDSADIEMNVARDKYARMCQILTDLISMLNPNEVEEDLVNHCDRLLNLMFEFPEMKSNFITYHGMIPILEMLEIGEGGMVAWKMLQIVNLVIQGNIEFQENLCMIGGIPAIMKFASKRYLPQVRLEAAYFIEQLCHTSTLTLQMFIACRGLKTLVDFLSEMYASETKELVWIAINGIEGVFGLQTPTPRNDFCRLFAKFGLLEPLSQTLINVLADEDQQCAEYVERVVNTFLLFSQADSTVKESIARVNVVNRMLTSLDKLPPSLFLVMLKCIKTLSMDSSTLDVLEKSNTIPVLIGFLDRQEGTFVKDMRNQILNTIFNLCRINPRRQEEAAFAGVIPHLQHFASEPNSPLKQFALPILCDMVHAGKTTRQKLWHHDGLRFYLGLLKDQYWLVNALETALFWLQEDFSKVEAILSQSSSVELISQAFIIAKANSFENLLEPLSKIIRISSKVANGLVAKSTFMRRLIDKLNHPKAGARLNLLRILLSMCDYGGLRKDNLIQKYGIINILRRLQKDDPAILVSAMAREVIDALGVASDPRSGQNRARNPRRVREMLLERSESAMSETYSDGSFILASPLRPQSTQPRRIGFAEEVKISPGTTRDSDQWRREYYMDNRTSIEEIIQNRMDSLATLESGGGSFASNSLISAVSGSVVSSNQSSEKSKSKRLSRSKYRQSAPAQCSTQ